MKIKDVVLSKGLTGFYFDDQKAIRRGNFVENGLAYDGEPLTPGFTSIRQAGESVSVQLILENGQVAYGDCAAVQYSGAGGRDPLFLADDYIPTIEKYVVPVLRGKKLASFRKLAEEIEQLKDDQGKSLHTAIRFGVSQAILDAVARSRGVTMAEVIVDEYDLELIPEPVLIFCQSGDDRKLNADRMIIKQADMLPHGLYNNVKKLGANGEHLKEYLGWLKDRVQELKTCDDYMPDFQVDVYGTIGEAFDNDIVKVGEYARELTKIVAPHKLLIEGPIEFPSRDEQIKAMAELRKYVDDNGIPVKFVVDEWCNTLQDIKDFTDAKAGHMIQIKAPDLGSLTNSVEAIIYCHENNMIPYLGGTCNETERSAQITVQVAVAARPRQILSKPGMGVDEGLSICTNEMNRLVALLKRKAR
ncbi:MAG: methylaspartate ammonia-lyase [Bacteroidales bacterium]|nr:methylaspartate ammonia-lyase [Bacteroidales bacterium]HHY15666.1 methylaspartate ammonia-lyase [Bacillota bacterium]